MKILTVNPGSTSTKIALFDGDQKLFSVNVSHDAAVLSQFTDQESQLPYRMETIHKALSDNQVDLSGLSACIGAMAAVLKGRVDGILLGGGIVHNKGLVQRISEDCGFIAPVSAYPGEFEMEAMASGAIRVLTGEEQPKVYTGIKVFRGFDENGNRV